MYVKKGIGPMYSADRNEIENTIVCIGKVYRGKM